MSTEITRSATATGLDSAGIYGMMQRMNAPKHAWGEAPPYVTKDGSVIRELMHPAVHAGLGVARQSLAEARVPPGGRTHLHRHRKTEELYHVTAGQGTMRLGEQAFPIAPGDTVCIPPGTLHGLENPGADELVVLCCCAPSYSHDDTVLTEPDQAGA